MNDIYKSKVEGDTFNDLFTDEAQDTLKPNCVSLLLDIIWQIITDQATTADKTDYLKSIIIGCKTKLAITFTVLEHNTDRKKYLPITCGDEMGKGLITDLLNHSVDNTTDAFASIEFHINKLYFIPGFIPKDLCGMAFAPFKPSTPVAPTQAATRTTGTPATPTGTTGIGPSLLSPCTPPSTSSHKIISYQVYLV